MGYAMLLRNGNNPHQRKYFAIFGFLCISSVKCEIRVFSISFNVLSFASVIVFRSANTEAVCGLSLILSANEYSQSGQIKPLAMLEK
jgi:hypothetical protein